MIPMGYLNPSPQPQDPQMLNHAYPTIFYGWPSQAVSGHEYPHSEGRPDIISGGQEPHEEAPDGLPQPDVVINQPKEPLYMNENSKEEQLPLYANEQLVTHECSTQSDEHVEGEAVQSYSNNNFPRGSSLPPMICDELATLKRGVPKDLSIFAPSDPISGAPKAPPRSRRGSTLSLNVASSTSDLAGLVERFHDLKRTLDKLKTGEEQGQQQVGC